MYRARCVVEYTWKHLSFTSLDYLAKQYVIYLDSIADSIVISAFELALLKVELTCEDSVVTREN